MTEQGERMIVKRQILLRTTKYRISYIGDTTYKRSIQGYKRYTYNYMTEKCHTDSRNHVLYKITSCQRYTIKICEVHTIKTCHRHTIKIYHRHTQ